MAPPDDAHDDGTATDFDGLVERYYRRLYQFALSLTHAEDAAADLTQQTFYIWAAKGHQLRDPTKVKTWLFTTLRRQFLQRRRHETRFPEQELGEAETELPGVDPAIVDQIDGAMVVEAMAQLAEPYRAVLALFYLEDLAYREIAEVLGVPIGTVQSRLARAKAELQRLLTDRSQPADRRETERHG